MAEITIPKQQLETMQSTMQALQRRNEQLEALNYAYLLERSCRSINQVDSITYCAKESRNFRENAPKDDVQGLYPYFFHAGEYFLETLSANAERLLGATDKLHLAKQQIYLTSDVFSAFFSEFGQIMTDFLATNRVAKIDKGVYWNGGGEVKVTYADGSGRTMYYIGKEKSPTLKRGSEGDILLGGKHTLSPQFYHSNYQVEELISRFEAQYGQF